MDDEIWIARVSSYNNWCRRLYISIYKQNEELGSIYYNIEKNKWVNKENIYIGKTYEEIESEIIPLIKKELLWHSDIKHDINNWDFQRLADYSGYNIYMTHKKYKSKFNLHYEKIQKSRHGK